MEKSDKKRILTRVLIVIAALTLLSCCFLGSTFARYVTSANGSGTVGVAKSSLDVVVVLVDVFDGVRLPELIHQGAGVLHGRLKGF